MQVLKPENASGHKWKLGKLLPFPRPEIDYTFLNTLFIMHEHVMLSTL